MIPANGCEIILLKINFYMLYNIKAAYTLARVKKILYLCTLLLVCYVWA